MRSLSSRALFATLLALSLTVFAGCGRDGVESTGPLAKPGAGVLSGPGWIADLTLYVGQSTALRGIGSRVPRSPVWLSADTSVVSVAETGVATARSPGETLVTLTGFGVHETYRVTVLPAPDALAMTIDPKVGEVLVPGQSRQFNSAVIWSDGIARGANVTFSTLGGTISSTGLFTAGQVAGTFAVIASCACGVSDTASVTVASLTSLAITPKAVTALAGSTVQFGAAAGWSNGATLLPSLAFMATGGSVSGTGQFIAPTTPGTYSVIVAQVNGPLRDTATVTVPATQLTALTIGPKTVTLAAGGTQQFTVTANWATGATTVPPVTYIVPDGGSVSSTGLFTAPTTDGVYRVIVAHTGGTLRDTAIVTVGVPAPSVTKLVLSPKSASLSIGQTQQFAVTATWSNGTTAVPPVTYTVIGGGGTISTSGLYTAPGSPGTYRVVVSHTGGTARDTATVTVGGTTATLTSLTVTPKSASLVTGRQQRFGALAKWSDGSTKAPPVTYFVLGGHGHIGQDGVFTAPTTPGTYRVVMAQTGGAKSDTATVTVGAVSESPTLPAFTPNRPSGMSLITDTRFGNLQVWANLNEDGLAMGGDSRNAVDAAAPFGPDVYEIFYPGNHAGNGGGGGFLMGPNGQQWKRMYFSLMMWVPENYSTHSNGEKFFYPVVITPGLPNQSSYLEWRPIGEDTPNGPRFGFNLITQTSNFPTRRHEPPSSTAARVTKGRWTRIEVYCVMNTVGRQDGILRAWIDGQIAADFSDVRFSGANAESVFENIRFAGTRGGGASNTLTPPEGQVRRYSRLAFFASDN